jgi:hypothetical protein
VGTDGLEGPQGADVADAPEGLGDSAKDDRVGVAERAEQRFLGRFVGFATQGHCRCRSHVLISVVVEEVAGQARRGRVPAADQGFQALAGDVRAGGAS